MPGFWTVCALLLALTLGLAAHGLCIREGLLAGLARPIDRGRRFRGRPLLGANKTWRGVVAVALGSGAGAFLLALATSPLARGAEAGTLAALGPVRALALGFLAGGAAMLSELPNSFLKRQLGIAPGTAPARGPIGVLFFVLDQVDMLIGWWLVVALLVRPTVWLVLASVGLWLVLHQAITLAGYALGMRVTRR